jgi:hypothetical protein
VAPLVSRKLGLKICGYALAVFMLARGIETCLGVPHFMIIETGAAERWSLEAAWIDPWLRYLAGSGEIGAGVLLAVGRSFEGGLLATLIMFAAVVAHLTVLGVATPVSPHPDAETTLAPFILTLAALVPAKFLMIMARPGRPAPAGN